MPAKNSRKQYHTNSYYHLYNRGVEKRKIFLDVQDYSVFLGYLKDYLLPKDEDKLRLVIESNNYSRLEKEKAAKLLRLNNFHGQIYLLNYCLMVNHFHFSIKQVGANSIDKFMNSLCTRYTMYFNRKYNRVGSLYQGVYRAVIIKNEEQLTHLSRYIHHQALISRQPSSYLDYLGKRKTDWINTQEILNYFSENNPNLSYETFVKEEFGSKILEDLTLDEVDN